MSVYIGLILIYTICAYSDSKEEILGTEYYNEENNNHGTSSTPLTVHDKRIWQTSFHRPNVSDGVVDHRSDTSMWLDIQLQDQREREEDDFWGNVSVLNQMRPTEHSSSFQF